VTSQEVLFHGVNESDFLRTQFHAVTQSDFSRSPVLHRVTSQEVMFHGVIESDFLRTQFHGVTQSGFSRSPVLHRVTQSDFSRNPVVNRVTQNDFSRSTLFHVVIESGFSRTHFHEVARPWIYISKVDHVVCRPATQWHYEWNKEPDRLLEPPRSHSTFSNTSTEFYSLLVSPLTTGFFFGEEQHPS
jgi:hypothetical protein